MTIQQDYGIKPHIKKEFAATGVLATAIPTNMCTKLRCVVEGVGAGNVLLVKGRLKDATSWVTITTITGTSTGTTSDISLYDELEIEVTTYSASGSPLFVASGFIVHI
jgi:hypothetical protein